MKITKEDLDRLIALNSKNKAVSLSGARTATEIGIISESFDKNNAILKLAKLGLMHKKYLRQEELKVGETESSAQTSTK